MRRLNGKQRQLARLGEHGEHEVIPCLVDRRLYHMIEIFMKNNDKAYKNLYRGEIHG